VLTVVPLCCSGFLCSHRQHRKIDKRLKDSTGLIAFIIFIQRSVIVNLETPLVVAVSLANAAILMLAASLVWRRRYLLGAPSLTGLLFALAEWSFSVGMGYVVLTPSAKVFWAKMSYVGAFSAMPFFLIFCLYFAHQSAWLTPRRLLALWLFPALALGLTWTNEWHLLIWRGYEFDPTSSALVFQYGIVFYIYIAYVYICTFAAVFVLLKLYRSAAKVYRAQVRLILLAISVPLISVFIRITGLNPAPGIKITALVLVFSGVLLTWGFLSNRLLDLAPVERAVLIDNLFDGVLVLDVKNRIVDINAPALKMLRLEKAPLGEDVFLALEKSPLLAAILIQKPKTDVSVQLFSDPQQFVEVRMHPLTGNRRQVGYLAVLRDITAQKHMERELKDKAYELSLQASTDDLTGIFNRRFANELLKREQNRAKRYNLPLSVAVFDVDNFKAYNDTRGHAFGDACLKQIAMELKRSLRASDMAARIGGDEFLAIFPNTAVEQAVKAMERLRRSLATAQIGDTLPEEVRITISCGLTQVLPHEELEDVLQRADQLLYRAKELGKDRVVTDSESIASSSGSNA
jgi:diguanylate cyclase (GGDEF)-like protein